MKLQAYIAIALLHPEEDRLRVSDATQEEQNTELVMEPELVLANSTESARTLAARKIDEKHVKHMHRIEVIVRPF